MYYSANDYELLYLIKDGNAVAKKVFWNKYLHFLDKLYREKYYKFKLIYEDYIQEGLLCLEHSIQTYQNKQNCLFITYFFSIIRYRILNLCRKDSILLKEQDTVYMENAFVLGKEGSYFLQIIKKELNFQNELEIDLFNECILQHKSVAFIAKRHKVSYQFAYLKFKKMKENIENILTN